MANKKVKPSEDFYDFLPEPVQNSTKIKTISEKNVLATLCYEYISHNVYALNHDGWFYCSHKEIMDGCELEFAQLKRVLVKLEIQKLIERKPGTNHRCTHYRLHQAIVELLPKVEANEPLAVEGNVNNEPLVEDEIIEPKTLNEPLVKYSLDKTSQGKTSLIVSSDTVEVVSKAAFEDAASQQPDLKVVLKEWMENMDSVKTVEQLEQTKQEVLRKLNALNTLPQDFKNIVEPYRDHYEFRYAALRH